MAAGQLVFNRKLRPVVRLGLLALLLAAAYVVWFHAERLGLGLGALYRGSRHRRLALALAPEPGVGVLAGGRPGGLLAVVLFPIALCPRRGRAGAGHELGRAAAPVPDRARPGQNHPILGLGPAAYRHYAFTKWLSLGVGEALYIRPAVSSHNNYIDIYAQMGLVGLGLFLWFIVELGIVGWRLAPASRATLRRATSRERWPGWPARWWP